MLISRGKYPILKWTKHNSPYVGGIQYSLGFWFPRTELQILCQRNLESGFLELHYGFHAQQFFGFRNPDSLIWVDIKVSKWMLHIHPSSIQGSLGLQAIHNSKEQSDLSIPEYSSRFVLCCFGITVHWSLLIRQQDLDTVIITTISLALYVCMDD